MVNSFPIPKSIQQMYDHMMHVSHLELAAILECFWILHSCHPFMSCANFLSAVCRVSSSADVKSILVPRMMSQSIHWLRASVSSTDVCHTLWELALRVRVFWIWTSMINDHHLRLKCSPKSEVLRVNSWDDVTVNQEPQMMSLTDVAINFNSSDDVTVNSLTQSLSQFNRCMSHTLRACPQSQSVLNLDINDQWSPPAVEMQSEVRSAQSQLLRWCHSQPRASDDVTDWCRNQF